MKQLHTIAVPSFYIDSNIWLVGLLAFGEGWHNIHHAFLRAAFHGLRWRQFDLSADIIRGLEQLGLARQVWRIPTAKLQARSRLNGSVSKQRTLIDKA